MCCQAQAGPTNGLLKNEDGVPYNAADADLAEVRNAPLLKDVRASMIRGEWNNECIRCKKETESGMNTRPIYESENWIDTGRYEWDDVLAHTLKDGTIDTEEIKLSFLDLRLGNFCNIKCISCSPTESNQWYGDYVEMRGDTFSDSHGIVKLIKNSKGRYSPEKNVYDWHQSEAFWKQMDARIPDISEVYIAGGEPFLIDQHYEFLQKCVDQGQAGKMTIDYNSNLTSIPKRAWDIWKNFKLIKIGVSIDGIGPLNNYMRFPSNFNQIHENLKKLSVAEGRFSIRVSATISILNIVSLPEMLEWMILNKMPRVNSGAKKPLLTPHPLHEPLHLNIKTLPGAAKDYIKAKFEASIPSLYESIDRSELIKNKEACRAYVSKIFSQYLDYMYAEDLSNLMPQFWTNTRKLDELRGNSIELAAPELYDIIKHTEVTQSV
jgi:hypothetical protein